VLVLIYKYLYLSISVSLSRALAVCNPIGQNWRASDGVDVPLKYIAKVVWPAVADYHAMKGDGCAFVAGVGGECKALVWAGDGLLPGSLFLVVGGSIRVVLDME
jgi:hypothetical protein